MHEFGQGTHPRVVRNVLVIEANVLCNLVVSNVLTFLGLGHVCTGPVAGFRLELELGVDIVLEQTYFGVGEMPHLVYDLDDLPLGHGSFQFGRVPCAGELVLIVSVRAPVGHVVEG